MEVRLSLTSHIGAVRGGLGFVVLVQEDYKVEQFADVITQHFLFRYLGV